MKAGAGNAAAESLAAAALTFLRRYPPFDEMEERPLRFLASRLAVGYHPKGEPILRPEDGEPQSFYIVRSGRVHVGRAETYHLSRGADLALGPGEYFSVGALVEHRAVGAAYVAAADTFCLQLPAADFRELLHRSPRFQEFSTRYLASLLRESRRLLSMHRASLAAEQQAMGRTLRSLIHRAPVTCAPGATIGEALRAMKSAEVGSIIVTAADGSPAGIFTHHDVLDRVVMAGRGLEEPIAAVMTPSPRALSADANAYDAALLIARHGIRHVPVMDGGRLTGVVTERDLFALQRVGIRAIHRTIADSTEAGQLQQAARDIRGLVRSLVELGSAAEPLTHIVSTLNDALTRRLLELEELRHSLAGITWGWLGFGSEGRYEQTIATDQDNGIIFTVPRGESVDGARRRLLPFARAVNQALADCGFPLCAGDIMAGNPRWCLSLDEWLRRFDGWIADSSPQALLDAAIFFDFRLLHGAERPADALHERLLALSARNPRFLRQMAEQAVAVRPPLGTFSDFVTEETPDGRATLDLKLAGSRLFVDAARIMALAQGVAHAATAERLRRAGHKLGVSADETSSVVEAFFFIQMLRLRRQMATDGRTAANRLAPAELNEVDRLMLKESLRQARRLQTRLALDYGL